jgi:tRNA G18 (ribose-2'-O)-methylase SpoU
MGIRGLQKIIDARKVQAERRFLKHKQRNRLAEPGVHQFAIILDNLKSTYNIGKIFRSADAFGALSVHLIGTDFFDPGPAKGSFKWVPARFYEDFASCYEYLKIREYTFFILEPNADTMLAGTALPVKSAFIFGHEQFGISFDKTCYPAMKELSIPQYGKVESLNVSIAASVVMYEYVRQHCRLFVEADVAG